MIYPLNLEIKQPSEKQVYNALSKLPDESYTSFYSQEFVSDYRSRERNQYEIDFIVAYHPNEVFKALLTIEVKGGNIQYNGINDQWFQSSRLMSKSPIKQATSSTHSFIRRYSKLIKDINTSWCLCFPDADISQNQELPNNISRIKILDHNDLLYLEDSLYTTFENICNSFNRAGSSMGVFNRLKDELLRSCDFFKPLGREIKENNEKFLKLTKQQSKIVKAIKSNNDFCIQGPAGSGKTLIAYQQALEYKRQGLNVMYVTFNKKIAQHIRSLLKQETAITENEGTILCTSFHHWAKIKARSNDSFDEKRKGDDLFKTYIPNKALDIVKNEAPIHDVLIIDEGQDFRLNWLELLSKTLVKDGRILIFMDKNQDIFNSFSGVPNHRHFVKLELEENCRNTKNIIEFINNIFGSETMIPMEDTPQGSEVILKQFEDNKQQIEFINTEIHNLINKHQVSPSDIIIITNNSDRVSSLKGIKQIGGYDLLSVYDRSYGRNHNAIYHTTINVFKGLEAEVIFILDAQNIKSDKKLFYTQVSRAKSKLYVSLSK